MTSVPCSCIETIRCHRLQLQHLAYHEARMNKTRKDLWHEEKKISLAELLIPPASLNDNLYKCRVTYRNTIERIEWEPYVRRRIQTLKVVQADNITYNYKFSQRHDLDSLYSLRGLCDDILIVRNGYLTDTYVCNIALSKGGRWYTPDTPLLHGTQRAWLLDQGIILQKNIPLQDLSTFSSIRLFNAMMPWPEAIELDVRHILV